MTADRLRTPFGLALAAFLALLTVLAGWMAIRSAAISRGGPVLARIAPDHPDVMLDRTLVSLVKNRGILQPAEVAAVKAAALRAPLDARPYLVLGHESLLKRRDAQALAQLEAGQRLDPRQRLVHLLLLDRYLRTERYTDAAAQFAVLSRLVGRAQAPIAQALGQMSVAPETRDAVRRTLRSDPRLERTVLISLAQSKTDPRVVMGLASPAAMAVAGVPGEWGSTLVDRMVADGQYGPARAVWQRVHRLSDAQVATPLYDAGFRRMPGSPPFNWRLASNTIGAADLRNGVLSIDYYGRQTGELAAQLLVLSPGAYRFDFVLGGSPTAAGTTLGWSLTCADRDKRVLMNMAVPPVASAQRRVGASFSVPAGCPAQWLVLTGNAGEFPAPITATVQSLSLRPAGARP